VVLVGAEAARGLAQVVPANRINDVIGRTTTRNVMANDWVSWSDLSGRHQARPAGQTVAVVLSIDPRMGSASLLRRGDRVNVLGTIAVGSQPPRTYRIIEAVTVKAIVRTGANTTPAQRRSARKITVAVPATETEKLNRILDLAEGPLWVELLPRGYPPPASAGRIKAELLKLLEPPSTQPAAGR